MAAFDQVFEQAAAEGISVLFGSGDGVTGVGGSADGITKNNTLAFTDAWFSTAKIEFQSIFGGPPGGDEAGVVRRGRLVQHRQDRVDDGPEQVDAAFDEA